MRLRRLDLVRYGKFTDKTVDFGQRPEQGPDLHIVFGLNEAGKSTALSGYLDLLFGIEERSRYNFLHEYGAMRIGGVLELSGEEQVFARTKQRNNSLFNEVGQPVSEVALSAHLAGLSRDAYTTMFSLDDETLEAGGRAILESRGDLGKLLFTASAGLGHASDTLGALEADADRIHRRQAQNTEIALLKKRLAELKADRDAIDTLASTYESLETERSDAKQQYDRTVSERAALTARLETISKYLRALPMLNELERKKALLAELPDLVTPARTWTGSVAEMIDDDASLRTRQSALADEIEKVHGRVGSIELDEQILAVSERVRAMADCKARYISAGLDLPARKTELQILDNAVASCLSALGRSAETDPENLLVPAAIVGALRNLLEQRSGVVTGLRVARDEASASFDALQAARERIGEEPAVPASARARVTASLSQAREGEYLREIRASREIEDENQILWEAALHRLHPWTGDAQSLSGISVPSASQVSAWKGRAAELAKAKAVLVTRIAEHEDAKALLSSRLDALRSSGDAADDETAAAIRRDRDEAWQKHRGELVGETADRFALALARDDAAGVGRLANAHLLAETRAARLSLAETEAVLTRALAALAANRLEGEALVKEMMAGASDLFTHRLDVSVERLIELIEDRSAARKDALDAWARIDIARRKIERATEDGDALRLALAGSLESVGIAPNIGDGLEMVIAIAEQFLSRQSRLDGERAEAFRTVAAKEEELATRRRAVELAERRDQDWLDGVTETLRGTWLESGVSIPGLASVLDQLAVLTRSHQERKALQLRIDKMQADRANFSFDVVDAAAGVNHPVDDDDPAQLAVALQERLELADRAREYKASLAAELQRLRGIKDSLDQVAVAHERKKSEMLEVFAVETLAEVIGRDEQLRDRDRLGHSVIELEEKLCAELAVESTSQAQAVLGGLAPESLGVEKAEIDRRLADLDEAIEAQLVRLTRAGDRLDGIGGDSAVARIDAERRTILLDIEEKAARFIELKLGVMAAANALRLYRERHRSSMMARASDAFALITRGQYTGLTTQPVKGGEVLIALQRDGLSKVADALSKGARFQLYLSLRLAGYYEFAQLRPSVPFVADDIMETFDHVRSEEVFRLFGEMAMTGQVIYLTHHQHLCEIAREVVPGVKIHELAS
ncbi:ATP-binding protein [Aminobacter carboxidus]|uniref:AAA family ATPase n=1 Tax=Aminobacter carboxidus TaxID=376165 RepID=A0ABR9GRC0_9HYPH|nr:AAA family ATPase [Aminobacter carboxidus]MBE1206229.1 AAA family ATPase [Aminobacter carboxidus]